MYREAVTVLPCFHVFENKIPGFCPRNLLMGFVWFSERAECFEIRQVVRLCHGDRLCLLWGANL